MLVNLHLVEGIVPKDGAGGVIRLKRGTAPAACVAEGVVLNEYHVRAARRHDIRPPGCVGPEHMNHLIRAISTRKGVVVNEPWPVADGAHKGGRRARISAIE